MIKTCVTCKQKKQVLKDFPRSYKKKDGSYSYRSQCKKCTNKYASQRNLTAGRIKRSHGQPVRNLTNQQFGKLTVIQYDEYKLVNSRKRHLWLCKCECGIKKSIQEALLKNGNTKSCGCLQKGKNNSRFTGCEKISGYFWSKLKYAAKYRNIEFDITVKYIWYLFVKQNSQCKISGSHIDFSSNRNIKSTASLDRIDSSKGYIKGNVQWVHKRINIMKGTLSDIEFINWCKKIANNN